MATPPATQAAEAVPPQRRPKRHGRCVLLVIVIAMLVCGTLVIRQWRGAGNRSAPAMATVPITGSVVLLSDGVTIAYSDPAGCAGRITSPRPAPGPA
jgi:ferric-dicitrate binding protein FerR (iron transport regulator)